MEVSYSALKKVMDAIENQPPHIFREMIATRSVAKVFGHDNPLNTLSDELKNHESKVLGSGKEWIENDRIKWPPFEHGQKVSVKVAGKTTTAFFCCSSS